MCNLTQAKEECSAHADVLLLLLLSMRQMTLPYPC